MPRFALRLAAVIAVATAPLLFLQASAEKTYSAADLSRWTLVGIGSVQVDGGEKAILLSEGPDSKGVTLVSPESYGKNFVLRFAAKSLQAKGVNVVLLSISELETGGLPALPAKSDGAMDYWTSGNVANYLAAFHTGFHQPNAYIRRNPGNALVCEAKDAAVTEDWYEVELGRNGARLWLKVNGVTVCEGEDKSPEPLGGGAVGFRLRGPGDGTYSCLIKNVRIVHGAEMCSER